MPIPIDPIIVDKVLDLAVQIQQIPAPTFHESQRAHFLQEVFLREGLSDVKIDEIGNLAACLKGKGDFLPLVVSAHTDTVFPAETDLTLVKESDRITGPGIGDNSLGVAALMGLVWSLRGEGASRKEINLPGDIWLVANVGEEGLGDLVGMRAVVDRFGKDVLGYIVLEGMSLGHVYHQGLGVERYRITAKTPGGHSWVNYGRPSAIHELAGIVMDLIDLQIPEKPRSSVNVGVIKGGTSVNTIASEAYLELDLRSEDESTLGELVRQVQELVINSKKKNVELTSDLIGKRPVGKIPASHPLVRIAQKSLLSQGIKPQLTIGSTDANIPLSFGYSAVCVGVTHGNGAHTTEEFILTDPVHQGLAQLMVLVNSIFSEL